MFTVVEASDLSDACWYVVSERGDVWGSYGSLLAAVTRAAQLIVLREGITAQHRWETLHPRRDRRRQWEG